ncbi:hypothetical protein AB1Y20_015940 [Prymnesium parvum]|uniref:RmlD-like substrate binding domain-containing protein n=1 Tax=Prymnesium parvum TaxID=97485 RepID=A0AB34JZA7_PRYPA
MAADPEALVIRTNVVFGPEQVGKNFVYQLVRKLKASESMNVPSDQKNTPTYNRDLADATKQLVEAGAVGVFNVGGPEVLGRVEFAEVVADCLGLDKKPIVPLTTENNGQAALRPLDSGLSLEKVQAIIPGWQPRSVRDALAHWIANPRGKLLGA